MKSVIMCSNLLSLQPSKWKFCPHVMIYVFYTFSQVYVSILVIGNLLKAPSSAQESFKKYYLHISIKFISNHLKLRN